MLFNIEINVAKESLPQLYRRIFMLYVVDAMRAMYTQLKILNLDDEGPEKFAEFALSDTDFTDMEKDAVMATFLEVLLHQAEEIGHNQEQQKVEEGDEWKFC